jgi:hypothetical protein
MKFEFMSTRAHRSKCHEANEEWLKVICPRCKWEGRMSCMDTVEERQKMGTFSRLYC